MTKQGNSRNPERLLNPVIPESGPMPIPLDPLSRTTEVATPPNLTLSYTPVKATQPSSTPSVLVPKIPGIQRSSVKKDHSSETVVVKEGKVSYWPRSETTL